MTHGERSTAMEHRLATATGSLAFAEVGAGAKTFVFLHFWGGSSRTWEPVVERLQAQARCVVVDLRGWGALTKTLEKVRTEMSLHVLAYNIKRMIKIFGVTPLMQAIQA